eukprot:gb/GECG01007462.1/.p1 GENE.gb/GECG01007462.1/~~gb/GECG01007462.1/.p1  ORF type:complete len:332 (+),score=43.92 gb/GECG01007462.1/:1-996(+)
MSEAGTHGEPSTQEVDEFGRVVPQQSRGRHRKESSSSSDGGSDSDQDVARRRGREETSNTRERSRSLSDSPPRRRRNRRSRSRSRSPVRGRSRRESDNRRRRSPDDRDREENEDERDRRRYREGSSLERSRSRNAREGRSPHRRTQNEGRTGNDYNDDGDGEDDENKPKEKPNFGLSGALNEDLTTGNVYRGIVLKWSEPPEARAPTRKWRLHVFKGDKQLQEPLRIYRQSAFLIGREQKIADILLEHPSSSKQHAVIQFRLVNLKNPGASVDDPPKQTVKPYIMDLQSANGTYLNGEKLPDSRYVELKAGDVLKFGYSSREYVLLHDQMV